MTQSIVQKKHEQRALFDSDFASPSTHIILDIEDPQPKEEKGIVPPASPSWFP
jgi:hypothetical protein